MTAQTQPEALHYAAILENFFYGIDRMDATGAAAVLRHQHARIAELEVEKARSASASPVELPEPFALYDGAKWYANEEAAICSCANMQKLQKVYTEQQVREFIKGL